MNISREEISLDQFYSLYSQKFVTYEQMRAMETTQIEQFAE